MNKNTVFGLLLIFAILMGYMYLTAPTPAEIYDRQMQDSLNRSQQLAKPAQDTLAPEQHDAVPAQPGKEQPVAETSNASENQDTKTQSGLTGPFAHAANLQPEYYTIESDLIRIRLATRGGRPVEVELKDYQTFDTLPLILFKEKGSDFSLAFFSGRQRLHTRDYHFVPVYYGAGKPGADTIAMNGNALMFGMRLYAMEQNDSVVGKNPYIEFRYTLTEGSYQVGFDVVFSEMKDLVAAQTEQMDLSWRAELLRQEKSSNVMNGSTIYYSDLEKSVDFLSESKDDNFALPVRVKWLSFKQAFFTSVLIADAHFNKADGSVFTDKNIADDRYLRTMEANFGVPFAAGDSVAMNMSFYFGPNKYKTLREFDLALERQIPLGWSFFLMQWINRFAVIPVFNWLEQFGMNYGIIILILTLLLKLVLFPVAYKMYVSSAKMKALKPEVDEVNARFPKKEDAMKKQQAVMALYKSAGVNPMAGCVPMLLQFPILLAMFRFFPASIELRQQSFLWAHDLSSYDSILDLGFNIPFYGDHVSLFTLLMTVSTIMYTKLNSQMMSGSTQMPGMKLMMYMMPVMFLGIFNNYASGLSYYYLLANLITFAQMYIMRQFVDEKKLRAKLQAHKQKPVKKSKFQQRLEEAAKQRGYKPQKK
jgi:YidC/Oxa1 family membrane protein insertase